MAEMVQALATYIKTLEKLADQVKDTFCQSSWKLFLGDNVFQRLFKTMLLETNK